MRCDNDQRRALVRAHRDAEGRPDINGLDYVELGDDGQSLQAYFIGKLPAALRTNRPELNKYLRIEGGRRVRNIKITDVDPHLAQNATDDDYLIVYLDQPGDFSTYSLRLAGLEGIDPLYDHAEFTFKIDCPSDLDCAAPEPCPPPLLDEPELDYLSKDYASFRQLLLDRLALIMPDWKERHAPDLGLTLVELLAYTGDHLSYYQDAVASEAYLDTARQRISVRRHARLVDYNLHEGCNARAWLALSILDAPTLEIDLNEVFFLALIDSSLTTSHHMLSPDAFRELPAEAYEVFESINRAKYTLRQAHNEINFYTWGQADCCLPRGASSAALLDSWAGAPTLPGEPGAPDGGSPAPQLAKRPAKSRRAAGPAPDLASLPRGLNLQPGDVLIFEEVIGPVTGNPADADPTRRVAVRLTKVTPNIDLLAPVLLQSGETTLELPTPVLDIEWQAEDALPFSLCLSAISAAPNCKMLTNISVARGNVLLVDHGQTLRPPEDVGPAPLEGSEAGCDCNGRPTEVSYFSGRFRPVLKYGPLTHRQSLPADQPERHKWVSAKRLGAQDPRAALPHMYLNEVPAVPDGQGGLTPLFKLSDLSDPADLITRLLDLNHSLGQRLRGKLSLRAQRGLSQQKDGQDLPAALLAEIISNLRALLRVWQPRFDLLSSRGDDLHFVVEMDNETRAHLRFGDNDLGELPPAGSGFYASYRLGNGQRGNLGAEAISQTVINLDGATLRVRNPLPASGGIDPEPIAEAKLLAPFNFRKQLERAILADDYAQIARREFKPELQGAAARLAWTGSWYEVEVALDPFDTESKSRPLEQAVRKDLEKYRRMGHDLRVEKARYVPLEIELTVCVKPDYLRGHVKAALLEVFSDRRMSDGRPGFFHPDRLVFGEDIALSRIVAAAQAVEGVTSVEVTKLQRAFVGANNEITGGLLPLGPFEIAQLDNDPDYPEQGVLTLVMNGGR